jgi:phosphoenolpyruvate carboxykinase (GTP)
MNSPVMQGLNLNAPAFVKNANLIAWVADMAALCKPDSIYWCDGSEEEYARLCQQLVDAGTFQASSTRSSARTPSWPAPIPATWPVSKTAPSSAADKKEDAGPTNNWMAPAAMRECCRTARPMAPALFDGCMRGRTMYVVPFSDGPAGLAHLAHRHRALGQRLCGRQHEDHDAHGQGGLRRAGRRRRVRALRPHRRRTAGAGPGRREAGRATRPSTSCTTPRPARSGPTAPAMAATRLLGKKCFALRIASNMGARRPRVAPPAGWLNTC